jgi:hypothetical protein
MLVGDSNRIPAAVCWRRDSLALFHHVGSLGAPDNHYHKGNHSADPKVPLIPVEDIPPQAIPQLWPPKYCSLDYRRKPNLPAR